MRPDDHHLRDCLANIAAQQRHADIAFTATRFPEAVNETSAEAAIGGGDGRGGPLAHLVLTVKACFDVAGWVTHAGSAVLSDAPAAATDAPLVSMLRNAGAVLLAQTNMTEFAYGALGLNDTFGTPTTPLVAGDERVSGGSTSGGAVAVARGMADISLGSDTSGSVRIPAAFCGVAAFKPSAGRYPDEQMTYLSPTFDVPGIVARDVVTCRTVDRAIVAGEAAEPTIPGLADRSRPHDGAGVHLVVPDDALVDLDDEVAAAFSVWTALLERSGVAITRRAMPMLAEASSAARDGGIIAAEAFMLHRHRMPPVADLVHLYDRRVGPRIAAGAAVPAHVYALALRRLRDCRRRFDAEMDALGAVALLTPTVPMLPPRVADLQDDAVYLAQNVRSFRLTEFANRLDLPSVSMPDPGSPLRPRRPIGLMLTGVRGSDEQLLDLAVQVEQMLAGSVAG